MKRVGRLIKVGMIKTVKKTSIKLKPLFMKPMYISVAPGMNEVKNSKTSLFLR